MGCPPFLFLREGVPCSDPLVPPPSSRFRRRTLSRYERGGIREREWEWGAMPGTGVWDYDSHLFC